MAAGYKSLFALWLARAGWTSRVAPGERVATITKFYYRVAGII